MCAQHEEGQRDGGVFPRGKRAHPINSLTLTQSCVTLNEMTPNLFFSFLFFKSGIEQMWKGFHVQTDDHLEKKVLKYVLKK